MAGAPTRQEIRQRVKKNIERRDERTSPSQKELITVDLFDNLREDNIKFFRLLDFGIWNDVKAAHKDPSNTKELAELIGDLLEGNSL